MKMEELIKLWEMGGDIPVDENDCIEEPWSGFPVGTEREELWSWFEEQNPAFVVGEALMGKYRAA